jgi:hypothetical protein
MLSGLMDMDFKVSGVAFDYWGDAASDIAVFSP